MDIKKVFQEGKISTQKNGNVQMPEKDQYLNKSLDMAMLHSVFKKAKTIERKYPQ